MCVIYNKDNLPFRESTMKKIMHLKCKHYQFTNFQVSRFLSFGYDI
jgi:hypothetical protein